MRAAKRLANVEKTLILPAWHKTHDQGSEGACVGFGVSMMLAMLNEHQGRCQGDLSPYIHYNPWHLWDEAKRIDEWPETQPGDDNGTSVRAACDVLRTRGHVVWLDEKTRDSKSKESPDYGISAVRWATTVDEMRAAINNDKACAIGVSWYSAFDKPQYYKSEFWIGRASFGTLRGGHCVCVYGASDVRQAFRIKNSWGSEYPEVWLPYKAMARLLKEDGESSLITDR